MSPRPRLSEHETEEHRDRIIEATFRVIAASEDADPPIRPILRESGLSRQAFYRCFQSKDDLMAALRREGRRLLANHLRSRMGREQTPTEKVCAWVSGIMQQAEAPYAVERTRPFIISPGRQAALNQAEFAETERILCQPLEEALTALHSQCLGESGDAHREALIIHDLVLGSLRRHLLLGIAPATATVDALAEFALRGLRPTDRDCNLTAPRPTDP
jgi:AcrR family transcriptional regulator